MSVLIKGMEMPKNCKECRFCFYDRKYEPMCLLLNGKRGKSDCPLVEIPPHGRLIDAVERKRGKWIGGNGVDYVRCGCCHKNYDWVSQAQYYNFCPHCGADMRGQKDD